MGSLTNATSTTAAGRGVQSDPIRLQVMKNALESVADGMALTVVRTSRSSVVRSGLDFSTGLLDHRGELFGQGMCQPMHLGGMMPALAACLRAFDSDPRPGDVFINNDPYEGGSHLPDWFLFQPIFADGTLLAYACAMAHHTDVGGRVAGGNAADSTEIFQEGLRIPPLKLYDAGEPNHTLLRIIEKAVRVPDIVLGDLKAQLAALNYGERELLALVKRYGTSEIQHIAAELLDYTEALTRSALKELPDGSWSFVDYVDDDGVDDKEIPIVVTVIKEKDECIVDFTGTGPQGRGALQPVLATTKAMVYSALRHVLGTLVGDLPNTSGYFRPVTVIAPEGTFVNPVFPAAVGARGLGCLRIHQALLGAFAQMLPETVYACSGGCELGIAISGYEQTGSSRKYRLYLEFVNESAIGGYAYRDGEDGQCAGAANGAVNPVESLELEQPVLVEQFGFLPDSEGAGKHRGGLGLVREYRFLADETQLQVRADRTKHGPFGLFGGEAATPTHITLTSNGTSLEMPGKFIASVNAGDVLRVEMPGAGGWGNALQRDPGAVARDVCEGKVTKDRALQVYGVALKSDGEVDIEATDAVRGRKRKGDKLPSTDTSKSRRPRAKAQIEEEV